MKRTEIINKLKELWNVEEDQALAELLGVSKQSVSNYKAGKERFQEIVIARLLDELERKNNNQ